MRKLILFLTLLLAASPALAKPTTKTYLASCDRVWKAVEAVAAEKDHYQSSTLDDKQQKALLVTGHNHRWVVGENTRTLSLMLSNSGDNCEVTIEGISRLPIANNDKGNLFKRIEKALTETPSESKPEPKR